MRGWTGALLIGMAALLSPPAGLAQTAPPAAATPAAPSAAQAAQQDRMRSCNAEAGSRSLAGDPRRAFMRECLSRHPAGSPAASATPYRSEAEARAACGQDAVVWGTSASRIFHPAGARQYGQTQGGAYLCRGQAEMAGYRAAR